MNETNVENSRKYIKLGNTSGSFSASYRTKFEETEKGMIISVDNTSEMSGKMSLYKRRNEEIFRDH